jgi:DNA ligase-1
MSRKSEFPVMLAENYKPGVVENWQLAHIEPKLDGVRVIALVTDEEMKLYSRNGRELTMFSHVSKNLRAIAGRLARLYRTDYRSGGVMFDGEMCDTTFNEIGGAIHRKNHTQKTAVYHAFHVMPIESFKRGRDSCAQVIRRQQLESAVRFTTDEVQLVASVEVASRQPDRAIRTLYREFQNDGFEGAMVKEMSSPWVAVRTRSWMKMKAAETEDLTIVGWKPGKGKYEGTLGAIIVDHRGVRVPVSGMDDDTRHALFKKRSKLESGTMVAEIEFQNVTNHGSLRHPRFIRIRNDKSKGE